MNNPNPFVPKGSLLEQQSQRRSRLKIAVFCVLAVSVTGLVAMLIQGCKREAPVTDQTPAVDTNPPAIDMSSNPPPAMDTNVPPPPAAPSNAVVTPPPPSPSVLPPVEPAAAAAGTYEVVAGDTLAKIAKKNGVTLKALEAANPGVDPKKLKIKQKLNVPASTKAAEATGAAPAGAPEAAAAGGEYVVKSGDTLSKIAKKTGVSLKALRAANPKVATTDHIHVGDKLAIPTKTEAAPAPAADNAAAPVAPPAMPAAAPAPAATPAPAPGH
jgi:LysM repeat protein